MFSIRSFNFSIETWNLDQLLISQNLNFYGAESHKKYGINKSIVYSVSFPYSILLLANTTTRL